VWVEARRVVPCREGVHACRAADLSYWLASSLWEVELEAPVVESGHKLTARRGRLNAMVVSYPAAAQELGAVCAWRARDRAAHALHKAGAQVLASRFAAATNLSEVKGLLGETDDSRFEGTAGALAADTAQLALDRMIPGAAFTSACSAGNIEADPAGEQADFERGFAEERAFQSAWLVQRLELASD
jgi:hypothetical protein